MDKGKGKEVATPMRVQRTHGKDAKLTALVREADNGSSSKELELPFDVKKIGKKAIFRPILTSPFNARWPTITPVMQDVILHSLLHCLAEEDAQDYFKRNNEELPRTSARKTKEKNKRRRARLAIELLKQQGVMSNIGMELSLRVPAASESSEEKVKSRSKPYLCGINSVTRQMETLIREALKENADQTKDESTSTLSSIQHRPSTIFVCQADVDPPTLIGHFPLLIATYNAVTKQNTYLIKLPRDAEMKLSEATSLRRCSVLSIDAALLDKDLGAGKSFCELLHKLKEANIEAMQLDWLNGAIASMRGEQGPTAKLLEPRIKHMRSSTLLDMNTVKATKKATRKAKKTQAKFESSSLYQSKRGIKRKSNLQKALRDVVKSV